MEWRDIKTAPKDSTEIKLKTFDGFELTGSWQSGFMDSDENECGGWVASEDSKYPKDWCEGVCWSVNSDLNASDQPVLWQLTPANAGGDDE